MKLTSTTSKRGFGHRVNAWLDEPHGETFKHGKWRFYRRSYPPEEIEARIQENRNSWE